MALRPSTRPRRIVRGGRPIVRATAQALREREDAAGVMSAQPLDMSNRVAQLMPRLTLDLVRLTRIPSIAFPGFPPEPVREAHDLVADLLRDAGVAHLTTLSLPDTAPVLTGEIAAASGAPTVLLYAHYDVQPPGDERLWHTPPFEPVQRDGAIYGRGVADDKANLMMVIGALRAWDGRPPIGVKVLFEGQEEVGSALDAYPATDPDRSAPTRS